MKLGPESHIQIAVCDFARLHKIPFYHVPNEGKRSFVMGKLLKRMGMVAGFSDCFMPRGNERFKGLFIELKSGSNKVTPAQLQFINQMIDEGYAAHVAYSTEEAIAIIKAFYSLK